MNYYLRFLRYDNPSRQTTTQIHPDIVQADLPRFGYGHIVRVGDDADDPKTWPVYIVAHIAHMKQIADPKEAGKNALLYTVYLARYEEWPQFKLPEMVLEPIGGELK
ncbi:hypothetical protein [Spirosoma oryzicola]|uniref:hypothetical protein n=1 Tax=Spirosoma oryzicola TaxID=2898794 RepID=UPI001E2BE647|nr:hypothetical protein [Spirosoma oryzicola]UHG93252.1 hypothetical protein LQ777_10205 [Spirosoma oryzicola]